MNVKSSFNNITKYKFLLLAFMMFLFWNCMIIKGMADQNNDNLNQTTLVEDPSNMVTLIPEPSPSPEPDTGLPVPTTTPTVTPVETPEVTPTLTPAPSPSPVPEPEEFQPETLRKMSEYDYVSNSVTGISKKKVSLSILRETVSKYGKLYGTGMPYNEYLEAMEYEWTDETDYKNEPVKVSVDLTKSMDYKVYESMLKKISRYDGVYLYKIGESTNGRNIYAIEINVDSEEEKQVLMFTGQIHAREFAGGIYLVKQFADLIEKAQTDKKTMNMLKQYKFVAVPVVNVDGRDNLVHNPSAWKHYGELWKAYSNGTDGNRNYPGLEWGEIAKGERKLSIIRSNPAYSNYPGDYAGSCNETKAMIKWFYHYIIVEQAVCYIDYHQQGRILYGSKPWETTSKERESEQFACKIAKFLNKGNYMNYNLIREDSEYGLQGEGSSATDFAVSLATGAKFSPAFGFLTFVYDDKEHSLLEVRDLDNIKGKIKQANTDFKAITLEIGYGREYLGNSNQARSLNLKEYDRYHYDTLFEALPNML